MKKECNFVRLLIAVFVAMMMLPVNKAIGQKAYAVFEDGTLTLKYDNNKPNGAYGMRTSIDNEWSGIASSVTKVVFNQSFAGYRPTSCAYWFANCKNLTEIVDMDKYLNTGSVTDMTAMFADCNNIESLDLSGFNTANATDMVNMFSNCYNLQTIYVSDNWTAQNVERYDRMFYNCASLCGGKGSRYYNSDIKYARIDDDYPTLGYFTRIGEQPYEGTGKIQFLSLSTRENPQGYNISNWVLRVYFGKSPDLKSLTDEGVVITGLDTDVLGKQDVTISYGGLTLNTSIEIYKPIASLDVSKIKTRLNLNINERPSGMVTVINEDGSSYEIDIQKTKITGLDKTLGTHEVCVDYRNGDAFFTIEYYDGPTPYAVFSDGTLTFRYDYNKPEGAYGMRSATNNAWYDVADQITKVVFDKSFEDYYPTSCAYWFENCKKLTEIVNMDKYLNTENVIDMGRMFLNCSGLTSIDVSKFNTEKVDYMNFMFNGCSGLTSIDVSNFNTKNVTHMNGMFNGCSALTTLDLSNFNTENVIYMNGMFWNCSNLTSLNLSSFNTDNVTGMYSMFDGCSSLTSLDLSNFDTENVTAMNSMFSGCSSLTNLDLSNFDTGNVTNMGSMFSGCSGLTSLDLSNFDTENVTNMGSMFSGCSSLTSLDLNSFNTENVTAMYAMFKGCSSLTNLDLSSFNTENVTAMYAMFEGCSSLTNLDLSSFNTGNVTSMNSMFSGCSGFTSLDLSNFNTDNVTSMNSMFSGCSGFTSLDLSNFNTENVTNMGSMFRGCSSLTSLNVNSFNTDNVTDMSRMFLYCSELSSIDVSKFNTAEVSYMYFMFEGCSGLTSIDVSNFNTENVTYMNGMFNGCSELTTLDISNFNTENVIYMNGMFMYCNSLKNIYVGDKWNTESVTSSESMFYDCTKLYGGKGTAYNSDFTDITYARIDDSENGNPGYFTRVGEPAFVPAEPYVVFSDGTLTFYYDKNKPDGAYGIRTGWYSEWSDIADKITKVVFDKSVADYRPTNCAYWFRGCENLTVTEGMKEYLNTENVTSMDYMFYNCSSLTTLDISNFNTENVTNMGWMFYNCSNLQTIYVGDNWNTPNLVYSWGMFDGCEKLVGGKGTTYQSSYTNASYARIDGGEAAPGYLSRREPYAVFDEKESTLTLYYDGNKPDGAYEMRTSYDNAWYKIAGQTTKVVFDKSFADYRPTSCAYWFYGCYNLTEIIGMKEYLNTENVTSMSSMFSDCWSLTSLDLRSFNTENVTDMSGMFGSCRSLTSLNLNSFNTENVTNMSGMFNACNRLPNLDLSNFNTENVSDMQYMFNDCFKLKTIYAGDGWTTQNVRYSYFGMFSDCNKLYGQQGSSFKDYGSDIAYAHIDGGSNNPGFLTRVGDTPWAATDAYAILDDEGTLTFYFDKNMPVTGAFDVETGDLDYLAKWKSNVKTAVFDKSFADYKPVTCSGWFAYCDNMTSIVGMAEYLNTENVTNMDGMFNNCCSLTDIDLRGFNTENVIYMSAMFCCCSNLASLDLSGFNTQNVINMKYMFSDCNKLKTIYVGDGWTTQSVGNYDDMFFYCNKLYGSQGSSFADYGNDIAYARIDGGFDNPGFLTRVGDKPWVVPDAYALLDDDGTLTFYYGYNMPATGAYDVAGGDLHNLEAWKSNVKTAVFDKSFADYKPATCYTWFANCNNMTAIVGMAEYLNTEKVTDMDDMFRNCSSLTDIDLSGFNTSNVISMEGMFHSCSNLASLDLSNFNTHNVYDMESMFNSCSMLQTIYVGDGWTTQNVDNYDDMFFGCNKLYGSQGSSFIDYGNDIVYARIDGGPDAPGYFTKADATQKLGAITITTDGNSITASIDGNYTGTDALSITKDIDVTSVTLVRDFTENKYSSVVLPFDAKPNASDGTFYTFNGVSYDEDKDVWIASISSVTSLKAHTPYIFEPNGNLTSLTWNAATTIETPPASVSTEVTDETYGKWIFKAVYETVSWTDRQTKIYGFAGIDKENRDKQQVHIGDFVRAGYNSSIKPFRCYLEYIGGGEIDLSTLSKSSLALPDRIEVRVVSGVLDPDAPQNNSSSNIETPTSEIAPAANVNVWSYDKAIYIATMPNTPYTIVDVNGRPLQTGITATDRDEIHLPSKADGIVIVIVGDKSFKIRY